MALALIAYDNILDRLFKWSFFKALGRTGTFVDLRNYNIWNKGICAHQFDTTINCWVGGVIYLFVLQMIAYLFQKWEGKVQEIFVFQAF